MKLSFPPVLKVSKSVDIGSITAVTCLDVEVTVPGARVGYLTIVTAPAAITSNVLIGQAWCEAAGKIKFRVINPTASAIDPDAQVLDFVQF
jgi:hypothetical protein